MSDIYEKETELKEVYKIDLGGGRSLELIYKNGEADMLQIISGRGCDFVGRTGIRLLENALLFVSQVKLDREIEGKKDKECCGEDCCD